MMRVMSHFVRLGPVDRTWITGGRGFDRSRMSVDEHQLEPTCKVVERASHVRNICRLANLVVIHRLRL